MLTLKQLQVLTVVAEAGSLNGAAYELGYGMPTISHHLKALEAACGMELIVRSSRGTRLTPAGELVVREARVLLARVASLNKQLEKLRAAEAPPLRIGTFASIGAKLVPYAMQRLKQGLDVGVELTEAETNDVLQLLQDGAIDVGLIYDYDADPLAIDSTKIYAVELFSEPFEVLLGVNSRWAKHEVLDFEHLIDAPWIMSRMPGEASDRLLHRVCAQYGFEPQALVLTDDLTMIHGLVRSGQGLALSTRAAFDGFEGVELRSVKQNIGHRRVWFVRASHETSPAALNCEGIMREFVAERQLHS